MSALAVAPELLRLSCNAPAENLALDEVLLETVCSGARGGVLRLWESPVPFVVLGISQRIAAEADEAACAADGVPVLRRCSAGGCVLQGPGSLNFTLALRLDEHPGAASLHASYRYILEPLCRAFAARGAAAEIAGLSDLAIGGHKVSGNAQRRKREAILHHGTLLYRPDYAGMARWLREPAKRPDYRGARDHRAFVGTLPLERGALETCTAEAFGATRETAATDAELKVMRTLAAEKYATETWSRRR